MRLTETFCGAALALILGSLLSAPVAAATITYTFTGHVTDNQGLPVAIGAPLFLSISYPSNVSNSSAHPDFAEYIHEGGTGGFGDVFITTVIPNASFVIDGTDAADEFLTNLGFFAESREAVPGYLFSFVDIRLVDQQGTAFASDALPLALDLADFETRAFTAHLMSLDPFPATISLTGVVDAITVEITAIPEPGATAAMGLLVLAILARRRRAIGFKRARAHRGTRLQRSPQWHALSECTNVIPCRASKRKTSSICCGQSSA